MTLKELAALELANRQVLAAVTDAILKTVETDEVEPPK